MNVQAITGKLTEFSPTADIMECLLNAYLDVTDGDDSYIYDMTGYNYVSIGSVREAISQLREADE